MTLVVTVLLESEPGMLYEELNPTLMGLKSDELDPLADHQATGEHEPTHLGYLGER